MGGDLRLRCRDVRVDIRSFCRSGDWWINIRQTIHVGIGWGSR